MIIDYKKNYESLICKALQRESIDGYFEIHHIVPKCIGGEDTKENLVKLTAREHFIAHFLLAKIHGGILWLAIIRMKNDNNCRNSRLYEKAKKEAAKIISMNNAGRKMSETTKLMMSNSKRGNQHAKGYKFNEDQIDKCRRFGELNHMFGKRGENSPLYGRKHSEETKLKMSIAATAREKRKRGT